MDAQAIFNKLSCGCKFTTPNPKVSTNSATEQVDTSCKIKQETKDVPQPTDESAITLLGDITSDSKANNGKQKRRASIMDGERLVKMQAEEEVNAFRNENNIKVVGRYIPEPARTFGDFKVGKDLKQNLIKLGYTEPTPIQMQAVPIMLGSRQLLACAPTGSGKTIAFLLPIIEWMPSPSKQGFRALIICPTRELAVQTQKVCMALADDRKLKVVTISKTNSVPLGDILITTPNRLCYLLSQEKKLINLDQIKWLIIDEADKLFEDGVRSFEDQMRKILNCLAESSLRMALFSATYTPKVAKWASHNVTGLIRLTVGQRNTAAKLIDQRLEFVGNESGKLIAFRDLVRNGLTPPVLVFVQSKERAQQLFSELIYDGINVDAIHADRTQTQRENTVRSFREGKIWVLICTELMARGIDFKGVNLVVNYDFPPSAISYVHRIGRAGRAGHEGKSVTFFTQEDTAHLRSIAHIIRLAGCDVPDYMLYMKKTSKKEKQTVPTRDDILTVPREDRFDKVLGKERVIEQYRKQKMLKQKKEHDAAMDTNEKKKEKEKRRKGNKNKNNDEDMLN